MFFGSYIWVFEDSAWSDLPDEGASLYVLAVTSHLSLVTEKIDFEGRFWSFFKIACM